VKALFELHEAPSTGTATQVQLDASINHLLGVQILHQHFVAADIPRQARETASRLGWRP
jgi:asparagine synthase (glutamine-hydrolysing)